MADLLNKFNTGLGAAGAGLNAITGLFGIGANGGNSKFSISQFSSEINKAGGIYRPTLYLVTLTPPPMMGAGAGSAQSLSLLCNSAQLPGRSFTPVEFKPSGYGLRSNRIVDSRVNDVTLTFFIDNTNFVLQFFNDYFNGIIYHDQSKGVDALSTNYSVNTPPGMVRYKSEYVTTIDITTFDAASNKIITYKLHEAFPMQMSDTQLAWASVDTFESLAVVFSYTYYTIEEADAPSPAGSPAGLIAGVKNGLGKVTKFLNNPAVRNVTSVLSVARGNNII